MWEDEESRERQNYLQQRCSLGRYFGRNDSDYVSNTGESVKLAWLRQLELYRRGNMSGSILVVPARGKKEPWSADRTVRKALKLRSSVARPRSELLQLRLSVRSWIACKACSA